MGFPCHLRYARRRDKPLDSGRRSGHRPPGFGCPTRAARCQRAEGEELWPLLSSVPAGLVLLSTQLIDFSRSLSL